MSAPPDTPRPTPFLTVWLLGCTLLAGAVTMLAALDTGASAPVAAAIATLSLPAWAWISGFYAGVTRLR